MRNEVRQKANSVFFFYFKMDRKESETTCNISNALAQELLTNVQHSGCSRTFAKGKALMMKREKGLPSEADNGQLRAIIKADPLTIT